MSTGGTLSDEVIFTVGSAHYRLRDVVRAARVWGDFDDLLESVRQGIACVDRATEEGTLPPATEIEAAAAEFRYDRDLISADETHAWLGHWGLTLETWTRYLQRCVLRERWKTELAGLVSGRAVSRQKIDEAVRVEGICSGRYGRVAHKLAGRVAAHARAREEGALSDDGATWEPALELGTLDAALERLRAEVVTPMAIRAEVGTRHLDWVRLECECLWFRDLQVAREAALCVRQDGRELAQVAVDARAELQHIRFRLEEAEPTWRDHLLGARAGDLLGPLARDDGFVLLAVRAKALPRPEDPEIYRLAEAALLQRAIDREVASRVKWHRRL